MIELDDIDKRIVAALQNEGRLPIVDLALPLQPSANETLAGFAWRNTMRQRLRKWASARLRAGRKRTAGRDAGRG